MAKEQEKKVIAIKGADFVKTIDRVTFLMRIHHQRKGGDARSFDASGWYECAVSEQVYERDISFVAGKRRAIDFGWLRDGDAGAILIENRTNRSRTIHPTEEEKQETEKKILKIFFGKELDAKYAIVRPNGMPFVMEFDGIPELEMFSEYELDLRLFILPR